MAPKEGAFNITIIQAKLQDALAKFQTKHILNSCMTAGLAVLNHKETTLKGQS